MKRIIIWVSLLCFVLLMTGCNKNVNDNLKNEEQTNVTTINQKTTDESVNNDSEGASGLRSVTIHTDWLNPDDGDGPFKVYLVKPDAEIGVEQAYQAWKYGPLDLDDQGNVLIDLETNYDLWDMIGSNEEHQLRIVVTSEEDIYLRNPLNEAQYLEFVTNDNEDELYLCEYFASKEIVDVPFTSGYPEGVVSLTFRDAIFVLKVVKAEGSDPLKSYVVSIVDDQYSIGRISRAFQYYDTPFFEGENMSASGRVMVKDYDTDEEIKYEGYPMSLSFDENGRCTSGDIIKLYLEK
ncbi:MAG: hypothetical protein JXR88_11105 [Clostridia bacterium]|nr:hypothetical protein [Clostridia bacterium]